MHKPLIQLVISLLAALLPVAATAAEPFTFEGLTYTPIEGSTDCSVKAADTSISGPLEIPSTVSNDGVDYTVTSIGKSAFNGCTSLASVTIPGSVTNIGELAFGECLGLTSVTILEGVTSIDGAAFKDCKNLASVTIPKSMTSIGNSAFEGCFSLVSVTIPDNVTTIGNNAFAVCESLTSVRIGKGVTSMGGSAFYGCISLASVTIPESVTSMGAGVFDICKKLNKVVFTGDISGILTSDTFKGIASDATFYVPAGTEADYAEKLGKPLDAVIGYVDGSNNSDFLFEELADNQGYQVKKKRNDLSGDIVIPSAVLLTKDGVDYFYPVTKIRDYAFESCTALTSVTIPDGVRSIGSNAFLTQLKCTFTN